MNLDFFRLENGLRVASPSRRSEIEHGGAFRLVFPPSPPRPWHLFSVTLNHPPAVFKRRFVFVFLLCGKYVLGRKGLREAQVGPCEHPRSQVWMPGRAPWVAFQELHAAGASSGPHTAQPLTSGGRTSPPVQEGPRLRPTVLEPGASSPGGAGGVPKSRRLLIAEDQKRLGALLSKDRVSCVLAS